MGNKWNKIKFLRIEYLTKYDSRNNCNAIIERSTNTLILGCKNSIIPDSVTTIGYRAFYKCNGLTSIDFKNVKTINERAFEECAGLSSIDFKNVQTIGDYAFRGCLLTSIDLNNVKTIGESAFSGFISNIDFKNVTTIGYAAFSGCPYLNNVKLSSKLQTIGDYAFYYCANLTVVIDSANVASGLTGNSYNIQGGLLKNAVTVYIKSGLTVNSYLTSNFSKQDVSDMAGYDMYVKI